MPTEAAQILLVEDNLDLRGMLLDWLRAGGYEATAAATGEEALAMARRRRYDLVLTDLALPGISGLELLDLLLSLDPEVSVIFVSGRASMDDAVAALREGRAFDFLLKPLNLAQLRLAMEKALIRRHRARNLDPQAALSQNMVPLSDRERAILGMLTHGFDNQVIAEQLGIGEKTVRNLLTVIYGKLGVANRTQAALYGRQMGLE